MDPTSWRRWAGPAVVGLLALTATGGAVEESSGRYAHEARGRPNVLLVTVDTLRADRMSLYGYSRPTSPHLDALLRGGAVFTQARTVEPLTNPALASMLTSLYPHQHGASRNGLRMRAGLASLPKALQAHGYRTAAFVGNWTLRNKLSGMAEHFDEYQEVLTRKRWFGFLRSEATAEDLTDLALEWLENRSAERSDQPFFLWVHYVEPHAPYQLQSSFAHVIGGRKNAPPSDRYDTEIAFVDHHIGRLLQGIRQAGLMPSTLVAFASDHGESLGEHDYWGHGRHLFEPSLHIPMALYWEGRVKPGIVAAPALNIDLAPTVLRLLGLDIPADFEGYDWSRVLAGAEPPSRRITHYQAHRGAVISKHESSLAREAGLLAVAWLDGSEKEIFRLPKGPRYRFDLTSDPGELTNLADSPAPSEALLAWLEVVRAGLRSMDDTLPEALDEESAERLRALGYVD